MTALRRALARSTDALLPLAAGAAALAVVAPSPQVAERSDLLLAVLVLVTGLGIAPRQLTALRAHARAVAFLVLAPFAVLVPLAWAVGRLFEEPVRGGVLALGVSSTEVAAVGLVALAGGNAVVALGALGGSLVVAALAGPPLLGALAGAGADAAAGDLVGRFALVVLVPLAAGLVVRARVPRLAAAEDELAGLSALTVVVLVFGAMSGAGSGSALIDATAAAALFLAASALPALAWLAVAPPALRSAGAFAIGLRDFAVSAALAVAVLGPPAAAVSGVYGVLMLLAGAAAAQVLRRRAR